MPFFPGRERHGGTTRVKVSHHIHGDNGHISNTTQCRHVLLVLSRRLEGKDIKSNVECDHFIDGLPWNTWHNFFRLDDAKF